jgi:hypothetical protein
MNTVVLKEGPDSSQTSSGLKMKPSASEPDGMLKDNLTEIEEHE